MADDKKSLHLRMDPQLHLMLKIEAAARNMTMAAIIDDTLRHGVLRNSKARTFVDPTPVAGPTPPAVPLNEETTDAAA